MSSESHTSILICRDAGGAGRMLLSRRDLRVRWALTMAEASSVIRYTRCAVCIAREPLAKGVVAAAAHAGRPVSTIVLLDPAQWASWREYFEAGATSVLQTSGTDQLLDTLSDVTGVSFRTAPRIPFKTEVRFALGPEGGAWQSLNLSSTGICLVGFPPYELGSEVDLAFELAGKTFEFTAVIAQILRVGGRRAVGLSFRELSRELRANIDELIATHQQRARPSTDPEVFDALDDSTILALRTSSFHGDALALMRELTSGGTVRRDDAASEWLITACEAMSAIEVTAIREPHGAPAWAHDAVLARLRVHEVRARATSDAQLDADAREIFGLCQRLADAAAGADDESLIQVTNIRAEILRALYDPDLFM